MPEISRICFGCEPLGGADWGPISVPDIADAISRALELGVNFFDTADVYGLGLSETRLSEILGARRHDVVIATKGGMSWREATSGGRAAVSRDSSPAYLRTAVEASLRRLRLDRLPVYFIHWPDPGTEIKHTFEFLSRLKEEGKVGHIGCSNFSAAQVRAACEVSEVSLVQLPVNLLGEEMDLEMAELVKEKAIGVVAYNVLANGLLTGKYDTNSRFTQDDRRARLPLFHGEAYLRALLQVTEISARAEAENLTCAQYAIASVLRRGDVVSAILGVKNRAQIEENYSAMSRLFGR
ncbi:aldo/keto reductase [Polaromonas eurypsychrophila]|uniref:aldo/keto reductase n=1 Tax=Polaromonas eurypsychrophila TaxID=1614635 RepID=UPI00166514EB|nr:aldo/keto reductase [Polaromonas eurypsychrophila]